MVKSFKAVQSLDFAPATCISIMLKADYVKNGFYRSVLPETVYDCNDQENYSFDDEFRRKWHQEYYKEFGCVLPFYQGIERELESH